ncbi:floral homeotic protein AGAMOUS-like [Gastrolobium bilobum]|uniref:floral homeotic protein AGAMOUS-like n=1 Tax=Gastrolobium bilobum TaxID=150636 RepID=UPI002AB29C52|nr:floral homeotic protein AGAMOUS-like [Gastrolobium bilobum]
MDSSSIRKSNIRKGKVAIKKVEEKSKRYVTFSKCKQGLFNKVTELSLLCQAETALVINSQKGKLYACSYSIRTLSSTVTKAAAEEGITTVLLKEVPTGY